jgi:RNA polymerase sigma-70 factor (ECF subfamily)
MGIKIVQKWIIPSNPHIQEMAMKPQMADERRIINAAKKGNRAAFNNLVGIYKGLVNTVVFANVKRPEETKDVVQEVFLRAFRFIKKHDNKQKFSAWISQIARSLSMNWISRHKNMTSLESIDVEDPRLMHRQFAWRNSPHDRLVNTEARQGVLSAVNGLSERYKTVLLLKYMEDLSYEEIAEMLGVSVATVRSRLYRAKCKLRRLLRACNKQLYKHLTEQREGITPNVADVGIDYMGEDVNLENLLTAL